MTVSAKRLASLKYVRGHSRGAFSTCSPFEFSGTARLRLWFRVGSFGRVGVRLASCPKGWLHVHWCKKSVLRVMIVVELLYRIIILAAAAFSLPRRCCQIDDAFLRTATLQVFGSETRQLRVGVLLLVV